MSDEILLRQAQQGDRAALEQICLLEWRPVYDLMYRTVQNRSEAQDLTQEVFVRALRSLERVQHTGKPLHSWFVTIALNLLRDRWRQRTAPNADIAGLPHLASREPGPEALALASLDRAAVQAALAVLPEDYRTVIQLRVIEGRSSSEAAALMSRQPDAVRQLQRRALLALRVALEQETAI